MHYLNCFGNREGAQLNCPVVYKESRTRLGGQTGTAREAGLLTDYLQRLVGVGGSRCERGPWTVAHQAPLSMEFSRQEHWSGLPLPIPDLAEPRFQPTSLVSLALASRFFTRSTTWDVNQVTEYMK